jgi:hypothetical protein
MPRSADHRLETIRARGQRLEPGDHVVERHALAERDRDRSQDRVHHHPPDEADPHAPGLTVDVQHEADAAGPVDRDVARPYVVDRFEAERPHGGIGLCGHPPNVGIVTIEHGDAAG